MFVRLLLEENITLNYETPFIQKKKLELSYMWQSCILIISLWILILGNIHWVPPVYQALCVALHISSSQYLSEVGNVIEPILQQKSLNQGLWKAEDTDVNIYTLVFLNFLDWELLEEGSFVCEHTLQCWWCRRKRGRES